MLSQLSSKETSSSPSTSTWARNAKVPLAPMPSARTGRNTDWCPCSSLRSKPSLLKVMMRNFTRQSGLHSSLMPPSTMTFPLFKSRERCDSSFSTVTTTYSLTNGVHRWPQDATSSPGFARIVTHTSRRRRRVKTCSKTARTTTSCWKSMDLTTTLWSRNSVMLEVSSNNEKSDSLCLFNERHILSLAHLVKQP